MNTNRFPSLEQGPSMGPIFEMLLGPVRIAVLKAALDLKIADVLDEPGSPEEIASRLGIETHPGNLTLFLNAMATMGLVTKSRSGFVNTDFSKAFLRSTSASYMGLMVHQLSGMQHRNLDRIADLVRSGPGELSTEHRLDREERWRESVRHLAHYQKAGIAGLVADLVADLPEFENMRRMLDIGCGPGIMCQAAVSRHPHLQGVLFDFPTVIEVAQEELEAAGLTGRISTMAGDYNTLDLGEGYDLIWASHCLYYAKDLVDLFRRARKALNPGGVFMSFHEGLTHGRSQPESIVLSRLSLSLEGQDVSFELGEIARKMIKAGFKSVESRCLSLPMGPMELIIGRTGSEA